MNVCDGPTRPVNLLKYLTKFILPSEWIYTKSMQFPKLAHKEKSVRAMKNMGEKRFSN